jgi:hypothetical protein
MVNHLIPPIFDQPGAAFNTPTKQIVDSDCDFKQKILQAENSRLRKQLKKSYVAMEYWKNRALYLENECEYYREQAREGGRNAL